MLLLIASSIFNNELSYDEAYCWVLKVYIFSEVLVIQDLTKGQETSWWCNVRVKRIRLHWVPYATFMVLVSNFTSHFSTLLVIF